jgi:threonine aldolase
LKALLAVAREREAAVHLDGARLWNAAIESGTPLSAYGAVADSLMVSLSKGLCAPVGSMLVADRAFVLKAREARKLLGGGMRQVGVLAAAGLVAIRSMRGRLAEDHVRARSLSACPGASLPAGPVETNIVLVATGKAAPAAVAERLKARGVLALPAGPDRMRFVTHHDVDDDDVAAAIAAFSDALRAA